MVVCVCVLACMCFRVLVCGCIVYVYVQFSRLGCLCVFSVLHGMIMRVYGCRWVLSVCICVLSWWVMHCLRHLCELEPVLPHMCTVYDVLHMHECAVVGMREIVKCSMYLLCFWYLH